MYLDGQGMPADRTRAIRWLQRAASENADARRYLEELAEGLPAVSVTVSRVNLRAGPSQRSRVLDQVTRHDGARLLDRRAGWSRLWFVERDAIGWVAERLLDIEAAPASAAGAEGIDDSPETRADKPLPQQIPATAGQEVRSRRRPDGDEPRLDEALGVGGG